MRTGGVALSAAVLAATCAAMAKAETMQAASQDGSSGSQPPVTVAATLSQCVTAVEEDERSATFAGEMTAVPGTARMVMRIDLQEQRRGEVAFHTISAPGLGLWRDSEKKVKVYKSLQQVTNLSAPATYRAWVRFRWLNAKGHLIRHAERFSSECFEPAAPKLAPPPVEPAPSDSA